MRSTIIHDPKSPDESDHILIDNSAWITVNDFSVHIRKTAKGVTVDIYPVDDEAGEAISSAHATAQTVDREV